MKAKVFTFGLLTAFLGMSVTAGLIANEKPAEAHAADIDTTFRVVGSFADPLTGNLWNWNAPGLEFTDEVMINDSPYYQVTIDFVAGDAFKVAEYNGTDLDYSRAWPAGNWNINATGDGKIGSAGRYTISIPVSYPEGGDPIVDRIGEPVIVDVTLHVEGETKVVQTNNLRAFHPEHTIVDGKVLEGWYYDEEFTMPYTAAPIPENDDLYAKYVEAPADYYIYLETANDYAYAYYWNSEANIDNGWPGTELELVTDTYALPEGTKLYRALVQTEYEADKIIFNQGPKAAQTADLALPAEPAVFGEAGVLEDSADRVAAIEFIEYWRLSVRKTHVWNDETLENSLCWLLDDQEGWNELSALYHDHLSDKARGLVDPVVDVEGWTIGQSMEYLDNVHAEPAANNFASSFLSEPKNIAGVVAGAMFLVSALGFATFFLIKKRKSAQN